jgi:chaperonin GroES
MKSARRQSPSAAGLLDSRRRRTYFPASAWHSLSQSATPAKTALKIKTLKPPYPREETMAKTKFRPLHDRVVVRRLDAEEKTKGGIIIPDTAKEKPQEGEIIAVGPGGRDENGKLIPMDVKAGNRVLFGKWSGTEVKIDGEELLIMKESDIMGVIA